MTECDDASGDIRMTKLNAIIATFIFGLAQMSSVAPASAAMENAKVDVARIFRCQWEDMEAQSMCRSAESGIAVAVNLSPQGLALQYVFTTEKSPQREFGPSATLSLIAVLFPQWRQGAAWMQEQLKNRPYGYGGSTTVESARVTVSTGVNEDGLVTKVVAVQMNQDGLAATSQGSQPFGRSAQEIKEAIRKIVACKGWVPSLRRGATSCAFGTTAFEVSVSPDANGDVRLIELLLPVDDNGDSSPGKVFKAKTAELLDYLVQVDADALDKDLRDADRQWFRTIRDAGEALVVVQFMEPPHPRLEEHFVSIVLLDRNFLEGEGQLSASRYLEDYFHAREATLATREFGIDLVPPPGKPRRAVPQPYMFLPLCVRSDPPCPWMSPPNVPGT